MKSISILIVTLLCSLTASAQSVPLNSEGRDTAYVNTIITRATKNISALKLTGAKHEAVRNIVANKYFMLNDIYSERDAALKFAKDSLTGSEEKAATETARAKCDSQLYRSHFAFDTQLSLYLSPDEITAIKDAMTYNKVKITYDVYLDQIPSLTDEEKAQMYVWLTEARELAIDAEGSKQKHEMFNKYKGRIANYLSKRGYNLSKEYEEWQKRVKERKEAEGKRK